jgi:hypothetical protein
MAQSAVVAHEHRAMPSDGEALTERGSGARQAAQKSEQQSGECYGATNRHQEGRSPSEPVADRLPGTPTTVATVMPEMTMVAARLAAREMRRRLRRRWR